MTKHDAEIPKDVGNALNFFVGGVPPYGYFELQVEGLRVLANGSQALYGVNQTAEVCVIALSAYFEAFCKSQFAALINICPKVLRNLIEKRKSTTLDLQNVLEVLDELENKLGNVLSEGYDFGSAKAINGLYYDLLAITPFSTADRKKYERFLQDRNLLVHHAGIYTFRYASQRFTRRTAPGLPHWDSLVVDEQDHDRWAAFLLAMGKNISETSKLAVETYISRTQIALSPDQRRAIGFLGSSHE
jgi:hypothetical protein